MKVDQTRLARWVIALMAVTVAIGGAFLLSWSFQSEEVLVLKNQPFPARVIQSPQGGFVVLDVDYCKTMEITGTVRLSFVSLSKEVFLPISKERGPKDCVHTDYPIPVPKGLESDTYKVKFRTTYDVNPIKKGVVIEFESKEFEIK